MIMSCISIYRARVFTRHRGSHIGVQKELNGGHVDVPMGVKPFSCFNAFLCFNKVAELLVT